MGCGSSRNAFVSHNPKYIEITNTWDEAWKTVSAKKGAGRDLSRSLVIRRTGWKTIRIFVSSTFKDFHCEREVLVKKVFPDLRVWCESRRLYLVECDLRWGVPKDFTTEATLRACLGEIDRCYNDNVMPFFINMTSERMGWIPLEDDVPDAIKSEYQWIKGLSVTEMEIMHGAYRCDNPNALFMLRNPSFLKTVPEENQTAFIDSQPMASAKLDYLKRMIKDRFPSDRVVTYPVEYVGLNSQTGQEELGGLDGAFSKRVLDFFKQRISAQYPLDQISSDPFASQKEAHESFMKSRCETVIGRHDVIDQIVDYISSESNELPFLLLGNAGSGKSSIMAKVAEVATARAVMKAFKGGGPKGWKVFYHFVGAVPGSTELFRMLLRFLKESGTVSELPGSLDLAAQTVAGVLANDKAPHYIIIVDALNQLDEDMPALINSWVPRKISKNIRMIFTMIEDTPQHTNFKSRDLRPKELNVFPLSEADRREIVDSVLGKYNKRLDESQMNSLMSKEWSENPLWLAIACEELRVFGQFRQLSDKINQLADGLLELEIQVLSRFEKENGGDLLMATVCLLEVSKRGLLETELLSILADEDRLMPAKREQSEKGDSGTEKKGYVGQLAAYKWSEVFRGLRPFLRPFGDSGEGRLDFYHRSLSKAVRKKYFKDDNKDLKLWWHKKLADFFQYTSKSESRKVEELPHHLIALEARSRLEEVLSDWGIFDQLYNIDFSAELISFWSKGSDLASMGEKYSAKLNNMLNATFVNYQEVADRMCRVSRVLSQGGQHELAKQTIKQAIDIEESKLGGRTDSCAVLYHTQATILDEESKLREFMTRNEMPTLRTIISVFQRAINLFETLPKKREREIDRGRAYNRLAFHYSGYAMRGGDSWCSRSQAISRAQEAIDKAIKIFEELKHEVYVCDCLVTKGVTYCDACPEMKAAYTEAYDRGLIAVGKVHFVMDRLLLNFAIYHEDVGDVHTAYETFYQWYLVSQDLYGSHHPKSKRPVNTLREPMYQRIARELGKPIPDAI